MALGIFIVAIAVFWLTEGTLSSSPAQTLSFINQKIHYTLNPSVNELMTDDFVQNIRSSDGRFDQRASQAVFSNASVPVRGDDIVKADSSNQVLAANRAADGSEKWIEVNLGSQHLFAHEGNKVAFDFPVSTGMPWTPTPKGEYRVWVKLRYANMVGGSKARGDYYNLPNVPYVMYFYRGYGIHGTYWHNNFGHPMSHGCVNVKSENMARLYEWSGPEMPSGKGVVYPTSQNPGIRIVIRS